MMHGRPNFCAPVLKVAQAEFTANLQLHIVSGWQREDISGRVCERGDMGCVRASQL